MGNGYTASIRRMGIVAGWGTAALIVLYVGALAMGLATLPDASTPIADPWFTAMELLILFMMPVIVLLMVAVHGWSSDGARGYALAALINMALVALLTSMIHFSVLTLSRQPAFVALPDVHLLLSFEWPSVVYSLDILAWDVFFPIAVLLAVPSFRGGGLPGVIRALLIGSGVLAIAGLSGVVTGNMQLRNIGIVGYAVVFPVAAAAIAVLFQRNPANGPATL